MRLNLLVDEPLEFGFGLWLEYWANCNGVVVFNSFDNWIKVEDIVWIIAFLEGFDAGVCECQGTEIGCFV